MKKLSLQAAFAVVSCLALAGNVLADSGIKAQPGVYDPGKTRTVSANWVAKQGLPDSGKSDHALILVKATDTSTNAAAGAEIDGVEGDPAGTVLGFDIRADSYSGAGAPRFNLDASDGFHFVGGSANGTVTNTFVDSRGVTWYRVVFNLQNPGQAFPVVDPAATINSLSLIVDEDTRMSPSGAVIIDNININGTYIGKPGNSK
jgi:hypothetical protein